MHQFKRGEEAIEALVAGERPDLMLFDIGIPGMSGIEGILDPGRFLRIHRSTIVNLDRVQELQPLFHGEYAVLLRDGTQLTMSRGYREKLQERLGSGF